LHPGGADDSGQWIVLALAHGKLARQTDLPVEQRAGHQTAAQHWYDRAVTQIDGGPGMRDPAIHAFRAEAAALFDQSDD
jgi:hypothetical protein